MIELPTGSTARRLPLSGWRALGARLATHRAHQRLSIASVGEISGLGARRVIEIELGRAQPSEMELEFIAVALSIEADAFIEQARSIRHGEQEPFALGMAGDW